MLRVNLGMATNLFQSHRIHRNKPGAGLRPEVRTGFHSAANPENKEVSLYSNRYNEPPAWGSSSGHSLSSIPLIQQRAITAYHLHLHTPLPGPTPILLQRRA